MQVTAPGKTIQLGFIFWDEVSSRLWPTPAPTLSITDPLGTAVVTGGALTQDAEIGAYHYDFAVPASAVGGEWTATVTESAGKKLLTGDTKFIVANESVLRGAGLWEGKCHLAWGSGDPDLATESFKSTVESVAGPTPTGIGVTVGRLVAFRFKAPLIVNRVRWFGIGAVAGIYTMAIYRDSDSARLWAPGAVSTSASAWTSIATGLPITLLADTLYWFGVGANAAGVTAGFRTPASPIASSLGITAPPGNVLAYGPRFAQVALTAGSWPATLPAKAAAAFASAGATGTVPMVFLDNSSA